MFLGFDLKPGELLGGLTSNHIRFPYREWIGNILIIIIIIIIILILIITIIILLK